MNDRRSYDAWGSVRAQQSPGAPTLRYCANLGHRQDDESGLVYMRARYYEPTSGRFISEDPAMDGGNWFAYCGNNPVSGADPNGKESVKDVCGYMDKFFKLLKMLGVEASTYAVPAVATIITKLMYELVKMSSTANALHQSALGFDVLAASTMSPLFAGAGIAAHVGAGLIAVLALVEIYNSALSIYLIVEDAIA